MYEGAFYRMFLLHNSPIKFLVLSDLYTGLHHGDRVILWNVYKNHSFSVAEKGTEYITLDTRTDHCSNERKSNVEWFVLVGYENSYLTLQVFTGTKSNPFYCGLIGNNSSEIVCVSDGTWKAAPGPTYQEEPLQFDNGAISICPFPSLFLYSRWNIHMLTCLWISAQEMAPSPHAPALGCLVKSSSMLRASESAGHMFQGSGVWSVSWVCGARQQGLAFMHQSASSHKWNQSSDTAVFTFPGVETGLLAVCRDEDCAESNRMASPSTTAQWADPPEVLQMLACLMLPPKSSETRFAIEGTCQVHFPGVFTSAETGCDTE